MKLLLELVWAINRENIHTPPPPIPEYSRCRDATYQTNKKREKIKGYFYSCISFSTREEMIFLQKKKKNRKTPISRLSYKNKKKITKMRLVHLRLVYHKLSEHKWFWSVLWFNLSLAALHFSQFPTTTTSPQPPIPSPTSSHRYHVYVRYQDLIIFKASKLHRRNHFYKFCFSEIFSFISLHTLTY